jgi:hypothetical protein
MSNTATVAHVIISNPTDLQKFLRQVGRMSQMTGSLYQIDVLIEDGVRFRYNQVGLLTPTYGIRVS